MNRHFQGKEKERRAQLHKERGMWAATKEVTSGFAKWCAARDVKSRGLLKVAGSDAHSRCLRLSRAAHPGQALATVPLKFCYNFLVASAMMFDAPNQWPLRLDYTNYNRFAPHLGLTSNVARHELSAAAWLVRLHGKEDKAFGPLASWVLQDTAGRDGIATALQKARGEENTAFDTIIAQMAHDSGLEAQPFLEEMMKALAVMGKRTVHLPSEAVEEMVSGSGFMRANANQLFVPTLAPLIDCALQADEVHHNCLVEYVSSETTLVDEEWLNDRSIPLDERSTLFRHGSLLMLRAIEQLSAGEYVQVRPWPKNIDYISDVAQARYLAAEMEHSKY